MLIKSGRTGKNRFLGMDFVSSLKEILNYVL